ncbi:hypothetical protein [Subtercola boreus]|nr:hypothetical protein [Subtercola boreus]
MDQIERVRVLVEAAMRALEDNKSSTTSVALLTPTENGTNVAD